MIEPTKKKGRPFKYRPGDVKEGEYTTSSPETLLSCMEKGLLDCQVYAYFGICKDTFYEWIRIHDDFKKAHDLGLPRCESWWVTKMVECWTRGDDKGFKYCIAIMNNKFNWGKDEVKSALTQNISIGNINMLQHKNREGLMEYIKTLVLKNQDAIDVQVIDNDTNKS